MQRLLTIDCWGTLLRNNPDWDWALFIAGKEIIRRFHPELREEVVVKAFQAEEVEFSTTLGRDLQTLTLDQRLNNLVRFCGISSNIELHLELQARFQKIIFEPLPELITGSLEFLSDLRRLDVSIFLICNTGWFSSKAITQALDHYGVSKNLNVMLFSDQVGSAKPSPKMFELAMAASHCSLENSVHMGDDLEKDVLAARRLGMSVIYFRPMHPCPTDPMISCVRNYSEASDVVRRVLRLPVG